MPEKIDPQWAWDAYKPSPDNPWDLKKAGHLYRRGGFGANWAELQTAVAERHEKSIDRLLQGRAETPEMQQTAQELGKAFRQNIVQARGWWLSRMLDGPHPLREKITLFWHNHFATSIAKVNNPGYMFGQYELMQRNALGNFRTMLQEMSKDPAMMVWLDTVQSKKGQPNENYARELMELFSLGIGNYTEKDIREAAKSFTGWEIQNGQFFFNTNQFDTGTKTVLGKSGNLKGEDIVEICLNQPSCPRFIARKMFRFLVSESISPEPELIEPLAQQFKASDFDIRKLVESILRSNLFFSPEAYRSRIKSPVDFALGIVRGLEIRVSLTAVATALETLGQNLFAPPSVKGWDGGPTWLNGQTLLFRQNLALALSSRSGVYVRRPPGTEVVEPFDLLQKYGRKTDEQKVSFLLNLFLQADVPQETRMRLVDYLKLAQKQKLPVYWTEEDRDRHPTRALCHLVLTLPEFQLD
jgi:uncharacterized protein (DUF1800 family)